MARLCASPAGHQVPVVGVDEYAAGHGRRAVDEHGYRSAAMGASTATVVAVP